MTGQFTIVGIIVAIENKTSRSDKDYKVASFSQGEKQVIDVALFGDASKAADSWAELDIVCVSGELKPEVKEGRNGGSFVNWSLFANKGERLLAIGKGLQKARDKNNPPPDDDLGF